MDMLQALVENGRIVDAILVLMLIETVALVIAWRTWGRGIPPRQVLANTLAGGAIMLALRSALAGEGWLTTVLWLAAGLLAHLADVAARWR